MMLGQSSHPEQADLFKNLLAHQIHPQHLRYLLGQDIPRKKPPLPLMGLPSHPIRKMASLLMLKHLYNLSDERVLAHWETNPYFQYMAGEATFQWGKPSAS
jgi:transposase, IS5 family